MPRHFMKLNCVTMCFRMILVSFALRITSVSTLFFHYCEQFRRWVNHKEHEDFFLFHKCFRLPQIFKICCNTVIRRTPCHGRAAGLN